MRRVEQKPALAGFFGTIFVWLLIILFFYVSSVLLAPKQYKTIKIRLDSTSKSEKLVKKTEESSAQNQEAESAQPLAQDSAEQSPAPQEAAAAEAPSLAEAIPPASAPAPAQEVQVIKDEPKKAETKKDSAKKNKKSSKDASEKKSERKNEVAEKTEERNPPKKITPQAEEQELFKSMDELLAEQQSQKKTQKTEFDWSQFDNMEGNSSSSAPSQVVKNVPAQADNPFSGKVANSSDKSQASVSSKSDSNKKTAGSMSSDVGKALEAALSFSEKNYSSSKGGVASTVTAETGTADGKVFMKMEDGAARALLFPSEPKITLSEEASSLIDSKTTLIVSFTVRGSDGRILKQSIKFSPDVLPSIVANEIREQISGWLFASPMPTDGIAKFSYTIQKQ